jgi:hypothetical protein
MNLIIKTTEKKCRGPTSKSGVRQPSIRAFMDDLILTTEKCIGTRWILRRLESIMEWARMKFKPKKSRSLVISKGKVSDAVRFTIQNEEIPTLRRNQIKCLRKWYRESLNDKGSIIKV